VIAEERLAIKGATSDDSVADQCRRLRIDTRLKLLAK
jgi:hypothetical protein